MRISASLSDDSVADDRSATGGAHDAKALRELATQLENSLKPGAEDRQLESLQRQLLGGGEMVADEPDGAKLWSRQRSPAAGREPIDLALRSGGRVPLPSNEDVDHSPESGSKQHYEALTGSMTAMQASITELKKQADETSLQQRKFADLVASRFPSSPNMQDGASAEQARQDQMKDHHEMQLERIADGLKERVRENERRSVSAVRELGGQLARANERMEQRQSRVLEDIDSRIAAAAAAQKRGLDEAIADIDRRIDQVGREARQSVEPIRDAMTALVRRVDALEGLPSPTGPVPDPEPTVTEQPVGFTAPAIEPQQSPVQQPDPRQVQQSPVQQPDPRQVQQLPVQQLGHPHPEDGGHRYAVPSIEQPHGDEWQSVRDRLAGGGAGASVASSTEKRGGLPLVAASALALAVAGGGALSAARGKWPAFEPVDGAGADRGVVIERSEPVELPPAPAPAATETSDNAEPGESKAAWSVPAEEIGGAERAARGGVPRALYERGLLDLENGRKTEGAIKLQRAAESGLAVAQYRLSKLHERGEGVARSISRARAWAELAANAGNVRAMHDTAVFYAEGEGGEQDHATALAWFLKAAAFGQVDSQYNLGVVHEKGLGVDPDPIEAAYWYEIAGLTGDSDGAKRAGELAALHPEVDRRAIRARAATFVPKTSDGRANGRFGTAPWPTRADNDGAFVGEQRASSLSVSEIAEIQTLLKRLGYAPGGADGIVGPDTRRAIAAFQRRNGMKSTGIVDARLHVLLRERVFGAAG